jgi:hypothetical protein
VLRLGPEAISVDLKRLAQYGAGPLPCSPLILEHAAILRHALRRILTTSQSDIKLLLDDS